MVILRTGLIYLSFLISFILAVTDFTDPAHQTDALKVLWQETQKRCAIMELNKIYQFRVRTDESITAHTQLIVGHIWKEDEEDDDEPWDFQAYFFDMVYTPKRPTDGIWGGKCRTRAGEWMCQEGSVYKFKGEVSIHQWYRVDDVVGDEAQALITQNDCYNIATNNCKRFASKLARKIEKKPPVVPPAQPAAEPFDMQPRFSID
ncbi:MAG: hypothetical protein Q9181_008344 [Wetmoreana brouardii]